MLAERERDTDEDLAYWPLGTHWTARGAYGAALDVQAEAARLLPGIEPLDRARLHLSPGDVEHDDWSSRLYLDGLLDQPALEPKFVPRLTATAESRSARRARGAAIDPYRRRTLTGAGPAEATLWVSHDSYAQVSIEPLAEAFGDVVASQIQRLPYEVVGLERPALILEYYVDRYLFNTGACLSFPTLQPALEQAFDRLGAAEVPIGPGRTGARWLRSRRSARAEPLPNGAARLTFDEPLATIRLPRRWFGPSDRSCLVALDLEGPAGDAIAFRYALDEPTLEERTAERLHIALTGERQRVVAFLPLYRTLGDPWLLSVDGAGEVTLHSVSIVSASPDDVVTRVRAAYDG
ncbi:MAG: hypothetical protein AAFZ65_16550, partial [Planctomycetota bacterium]